MFEHLNSLEFQGIFLNSKEWYMLTQLKRIFEVFVKPSIKLQGQVYITLPKSLLYIYQIYNNLDDLTRNFKRQSQQRGDLVS